MKSVFKWVVRLAFLAVAAWFLRPLYAPSQPTRPGSIAVNDFVIWTFHSATNAAVVQQLTVYGDGHSEILLSRDISDPDSPDKPMHYKVRQNKETGLVEFSRTNVLTTVDAQALLNSAVEAGVLDLQNLDTPTAEWMEVRCSFAGTERNVKGPQLLTATFDWSPAAWINRIWWQKTGAVMAQHPTASKLVTKTDYMIVHDAGQEAKPQ